MQKAPQAILVADNIQVSYKRGNHRYTSLKELILAKLIGRQSEEQHFQALCGVKIELLPGEAVGLIGHNGSGKSTLLKVLCGVLSPRAGSVHYDGTLASLIELGAGFDGELSGRENILLSFALMGVAGQRAQEAIPGVLEFAEIQDFADEPVKNYSSGMQARLGFACATAFRPDILLVDEVLAVGDENFQRKCVAKMHEMKRMGTAIVLVSHDLEAVERFCERAYVLDHGQKAFEGSSTEAVAHFRNLQLQADNAKLKAGLSAEKGSSITKIECTALGEDKTPHLATGSPWTIAVAAYGTELSKLTVGVSVLETASETHLGGLRADDKNFQNKIIESEEHEGKKMWLFQFKNNPFHSGRYHIDVRAYDKCSGEMVFFVRKAANFSVIYRTDPPNPHGNFIAMGAML